MQRNHRSRSFAPAINPLEGRLLLSGSTHSGAVPEVTLTATKVAVVSTPNYVHKKLTTVGLTAEVESTTGSTLTKATGNVIFEMVMPAGMKKTKGMKPGTTVFGTVPLSNGTATLTLKAKQVLKMPVTIIYSGDANYMTSTDSPTPLTKAALKTMSMGSSTSGMKM